MFIIGEIGIPKDEYWSLTPAETVAIVRGYVHRNDKRSEDFRMLYTLYYNSNVKEEHQKSPGKLWPLSTDEKQIEITEEEMYERNKNIENYFLNRKS